MVSNEQKNEREITLEYELPLISVEKSKYLLVPIHREYRTPQTPSWSVLGVYGLWSIVMLY